MLGSALQVRLQVSLRIIETSQEREMKRASVCAVFAGLASSVMAGGASLTIVPSVSTYDTSGGAATITASVYGDAGFGTHILGGAFGLEWSHTGGTVVSDVTWASAAWSSFNTDPGYAGGNSYDQIVYGQLVIPGIFPPAAGSENGSLIGSFTITLIRQENINFQLVAGDPFTIEGVDEVTGNTMSTGADITLGGMSIGIPAPGAVSMLGLGGLVLARRKREC